MRFNLERCAKNHYEDHALRQGKDYDYVWCAADVDIHTHEDFYELFILAGGDYYHYYDGEEKRIGRNTVYFFKPGESHGIYRATPQSVHFSFFAKVSFFHRFFEENPFLRNAFGRKGCLSCRLTDVEYAYIYKLANQLIHQDDEYQKVCLFLYNVITLLMLRNETSPNEAKNDYVVDLVTKLNNYTYLTTRVQEIYGHYPVAKCKLIKEFKEYTGMTIVQYQKKQKLAYAAQLLANADYQITQIAETVGFDSFSHFLRIFKEEYNMTPKEYRKLRHGE